MNVKLIGILIGLLVAVGAGGFLVMNRDSDNKQSSQSTNKSNTNTVPNSNSETNNSAPTAQTQQKENTQTRIQPTRMRMD